MREKISCIYVIVNLIDGKTYVGQTVNFYKRKTGHISAFNRNDSGCTYIRNAWRKYGHENFRFEIIERCEKEFLNEREIYYIKEMGTRHPNGYNLTDGGEGTTNLSQEIIDKKRPGNKGREFSLETRKKMREAKLGTRLSKETRQRMSDAHSNITEETRRKMSEANKNPSPETRKKMSDSVKGEKNANFGKKLPEASSHFFGTYISLPKYRDKKYVYWRAKIGQINIGQFKTELEAAMAYDKYVIKNNLPNPLNFPEDYK